MSWQSSQTPFVSGIVHLSILVVDEVDVFLIYWKVCQVRVFSIFPESGIVLLTCKAGQSFIINIDSPWIHRCDTDIQSQIKLETIDEEWIGNIPADYAILINWHFRDVINYIDTLALWWVLRFDDPHVILLFWSQAMEMRVKVSKLIWENVRIRYDVETFFSKFLLHLDHILAKAVFSREFAWIREMIDFLVFMEVVVYVLLLGLTSPKYVPIMALCLTKSVSFKHWLN